MSQKKKITTIQLIPTDDGRTLFSTLIALPQLNWRLEKWARQSLRHFASKAIALQRLSLRKEFPRKSS